MVNRGPSVGCQSCRERRVGCDKTKPACKRCTTRGQVCPGYRDASGVVFKDESKTVVARHSKRAARKPIALLPTLHTDPRDVTTAFFFRQCVLPTRQEWPLGNEYFEHILPVYNSASPSSALPVAVSVMALKVATMHHSQDYVQPLVAEAELKAVVAVNAALSNPAQRLKDETLLAILCLDFAQQYRRHTTAPQHSRPHLKGALALVRQRGPATFHSAVSRSLYVATRSHVLLNTLWPSNEPDDHDLILGLPEMASSHESLASTVQHILQQVLCLERNVLTWHPLDECIPLREDRASAFATRAQVLCERLEELKDGVSWEVSLPVVPLPHGSFERPGDALLVRRAFVFGQYICTYVLLLKLLYATTNFARSDDERSRVAFMENTLDRAQDLVSSLCVSVIPVFERSRFIVRTSEEVIDRTIDIETRPELSNGLRDEGLATVSRSHLICITTWIVGLLTDELHGAEDFKVEASLTAYLQHINAEIWK